MTHIDQIIADALAGLPETDVAILAREVVRLREARAVVVPAWDVNAFALACVKAGVYAEGDLRDALKNAETGYNFAISSARAIPADRVLGYAEIPVKEGVWQRAYLLIQRSRKLATEGGSFGCWMMHNEDADKFLSEFTAYSANQGGADHD